MDGTMAVVTCFAANFQPRYWAYCNGQILSIAQNQALFSLLGTTYGGNGTTTFALPNLQGRVPINYGQGPGLSNFNLGEVGGSQNITLLPNNLPPHNHNGAITATIQCDAVPGTETHPDGFYNAAVLAAWQTEATAGVNMAQGKYTATINPAGGSTPLPVMPPYLAINYIICLQGIYPSRN